MSFEQALPVFNDVKTRKDDEQKSPCMALQIHGACTIGDSCRFSHAKSNGKLAITMTNKEKAACKIVIAKNKAQREAKGGGKGKDKGKDKGKGKAGKNDGAYPPCENCGRTNHPTDQCRRPPGGPKAAAAN